MYTKATKYTANELIQADMSDLHVDIMCARADGHLEYAAKCAGKLATLRAAHPHLELLPYAAEYTEETARNR